MDFGTGPTLVEFSPFLRDPKVRHARILEVVERNSVIEGLPPFTPEFRAYLLERLKMLDSKRVAPAG
jgi:hypothetical protein